MTVHLIVGSAACVRQDLAAVRRLRLQGVAVIAVNQQIADFAGPIVAGCTMHPEKAAPWRAARRARAEQAGQPWLLWSGREGDGNPAIDRPIDRNFSWHGTSALFAVFVALNHLRATKIILAGCPIDATGHYYNAETLDDNGRLLWYRNGWANALPSIRHSVRSVSGFSRALLGEPTRAWLAP